ncbi:MAG: DUF1987 domain-containing protein [Crocinitomicaceae bacterium]
MTLHIEGERRSLKVEINENTGVLLFAGVSLPENANYFFAPVIEELEDYLQNPPKNTTINFYIEYLNTSSALFLRKIIMLCEKKLKPEGLKIIWHYEKDDDDIKEFGSDFKSVFEKLDMELKPIDRNPFNY